MPQKRVFIYPFLESMIFVNIRQPGPIAIAIRLLIIKIMKREPLIYVSDSYPGSSV